MAALNLSVIEIIILQVGAVALGIAIHFFITSRKLLNKSSVAEPQKNRKPPDDWKLKYFTDMEEKEKEIAALKQQLSESEEDRNINAIEAEELRKENKLLKAGLENVKTASPHPESHDYISQLTLVQQNLLEHHDQINRLINQLEQVKQVEEKNAALAAQNTELAEKIASLREALAHKEKEMAIVQQKETVTSEMASRLDNAYNEFKVLQEKIQKLESDAGSARMMSLELADLKEAHSKLQHDFEEQKQKLQAAMAENQQLRTELLDMEAQLKESEFLRQQLQKRVVYLEELNRDFQLVAEANKNLESQIKRIGELESKLNLVMEERDELARRHLSRE
jgi:DNA repair exonuclease SbcCD ATPase subunit